MSEPCTDEVMVDIYVESDQSKTGGASGMSAHSIGLPSKPLNGMSTPSSAAVRSCMLPSASPNAIYVPTGDISTDVMNALVPTCDTELRMI